MEKFRNFREFQNLIFQRIINQSSLDFYPHWSLAVSNHVARIILQCLDLAKPVTQNFGLISSLTWRSRSRSSTWHRM